MIFLQKKISFFFFRGSISLSLEEEDLLLRSEENFMSLLKNEYQKIFFFRKKNIFFINKKNIFSFQKKKILLFRNVARNPTSPSPESNFKNPQTQNPTSKMPRRRFY